MVQTRLPSFLRIKSMCWKLILPMELCKPLIVSATSVKTRDHTALRNTGPKYGLKVKALRNSHQQKKPKNEELIVCPYVWTSSGLIKSGIDAVATLDVIGNAPGQPDWWYSRFHEPST